MFRPSNTRKTYLWYLLTWGILLSFVIVLYHFLSESRLFQFEPAVRTLIDQIYHAIRGLLIIAIVADVVSLIFHEIKYLVGMDHLMLRKLLPTIRFLVLLLIWFGGIFLILEDLGVNTNGLLAWAGIWGALFALASKDIISNLLWSIFIILSRIFEIGETIRVKNIEGIVEEITLNYTKIMSEKGEVIFIPNKILNNEQIENITRRRFVLYTYKVPFKKSGIDGMQVKENLMIIEGKINEYAPIEVIINTEIPNAVDFVYVIQIKLPEESEEFDREMREFLMPFIFSNSKADPAKAQNT